MSHTVIDLPHVCIHVTTMYHCVKPPTMRHKSPKTAKKIESSILNGEIHDVKDTLCEFP